MTKKRAGLYILFRGFLYVKELVTARAAFAQINAFTVVKVYRCFKKDNAFFTTWRSRV